MWVVGDQCDRWNGLGVIAARRVAAHHQGAMVAQTAEDRPPGAGLRLEPSRDLECWTSQRSAWLPASKRWASLRRRRTHAWERVRCGGWISHTLPSSNRGTWLTYPSWRGGDGARPCGASWSAWWLSACRSSRYC